MNKNSILEKILYFCVRVKIFVLENLLEIKFPPNLYPKNIFKPIFLIKIYISTKN